MTEPPALDPGEIAWYGRLPPTEARGAVERGLLVPGGREALRRYLGPGSGD